MYWFKADIESRTRRNIFRMAMRKMNVATAAAGMISNTTPVSSRL